MGRTPEGENTSEFNPTAAQPAVQEGMDDPAAVPETQENKEKEHSGGAAPPGKQGRGGSTAGTQDAGEQKEGERGERERRKGRGTATAPPNGVEWT